MSDYDLVIRGGTVVTAADTVRADVGIRDGTIVAVADRIEGGAKVIDASGLLVMPGGIDSHVHLAQPSRRRLVMADGFESGTRSAIAGGNTTVIPFALQPRGASLRAVVDGLPRQGATARPIATTASTSSSPTRRPTVLGPGAAGAGRRRLHLVQGLHDLRRHGAERPPAARRVRLRARLRGARHGPLRGLRRHQVHDRAAGARPARRRPTITPCRGPRWSSARPPTAPSAMPSWSTCRS